MAQTTYNLSLDIGDGNANSGNITSCFNTNVYKYDEDAQIMRWLSPLEPNIRHQGIRNDRFDGVGDWLLETREFREWRECEGGADKAVLFCSGNPGVGKTYLSSLVIDSLCDQGKTEDIAVSCLYCDYLSQQEQTITSMMGAILKQLVGRREIPGYVREGFEEGKKDIGGRGLRLPDLMRMMRIAIASLPQLFICIDALDECLPKHLPDLLKSLRDIVRESPRTRVFLTGRPHVWEEIQRCFGKAVLIPISPYTDDIKNYLEMRLDNDTDPDAMGDDLRQDIMRIMLEKISDIFLLVSLNIDAILGGATIRQRRKKLEEMTRGNGLGDAYTETLNRVRTQKGDKSVLGLKVLMWVLYSERPLCTVELCHALGVELGSSDLDPENIPTIRTLLSSSQGLVTVEGSSSTVRLVHYTLKEHLLSDPTLFHSPHATIAEVCLTYLNFSNIKDLSPTLDSAPSTTPFLEYCSYYWGDHTTRGMTESVKALALKLLHGFDEHISAQLILLRYNHQRYFGPYFDPVGGPSGFTGLHGVAFLGIVEVLGAVLEMKGWDVNATDKIGSTALIWAAVRGQEEVVKKLLERADVNPDQASRYDRTPLYWASANGSGGVVKALLARTDVNPSQEDALYGRTPFLWAARNGHEGVVKMLLDREDVNPNQADIEYGQTPLSWAARNGHEGVVKMLLDRADVNPSQADTLYGQTPLSWAATNGHEGVVKMLLDRADVNPNQTDTQYGQTPLSWAARNGHEGVVKMLLQREDVNPNQADTQYDQTPLSWAARNGHEEVVKMLLQRADANPNQADTLYGQTPLSWAATNGHEGVIKMLLDRADVNPDQADTQYCQTPLSWAARNGHEGVVKMLLDRADVDPNQADTLYGQTPLSWAARNGHEGVVKMLLQRDHVNPDQPDTEYGQTPLSWAAESGHEGIVKMLLGRAGVNPDRADSECGWTPLSWAAERGNGGVVKMLLERVDVNPDYADTKYGRTPLSWAAGWGNVGIVKLLLERKDVHTTAPDMMNRTPLFWALSGGHDEVVRILLERENINPNTTDPDGYPPLPPSAAHEDESLAIQF